MYVVTRELDLLTSSSCDISFHLATCKIFTRNLAIVVRLFEVGSDMPPRPCVQVSCAHGRMCCTIAELSMSASEAKDDVNTDNPYYWFVNGYGSEPFNLHLARGAVPFGRPPVFHSIFSAQFMRTLRRYSVMVCRVFWSHLSWRGHQAHGFAIRFPLRVTVALSIVIGCDVTNCRHIDIFHYFADVFGFTERLYLNGPPHEAQDLSGLSRLLCLRDETVSVGPVEPKLCRLDYDETL